MSSSPGVSQPLLLSVLSGSLTACSVFTYPLTLSSQPSGLYTAINSPLDWLSWPQGHVYIYLITLSVTYSSLYWHGLMSCRQDCDVTASLETQAPSVRVPQWGLMGIFTPLWRHKLSWWHQAATLLCIADWQDLTFKVRFPHLAHFYILSSFWPCLFSSLESPAVYISFQ